mgnify:CR=1 FL=1
MENYKYLKTDLKNGVFFIELNRNKSMNALNTSTLDELKRVFMAASQNSKIKIIILHTSSNNFSAGADIKEKQKKKNNLERWQKNYGKDCIEAILTTPQITICVTNGYTLGGAAVIATACDFRVGNNFFVDASKGTTSIDITNSELTGSSLTIGRNNITFILLPYCLKHQK